MDVLDICNLSTAPKCGSLNANAADHCFTALHQACDDGYDVLALQEVRLSPAQRRAWTQEARSLGFRTFGGFSREVIDSMGRRSFHGGVCMAVKDTIPSTLVFFQTLEEGEYLLVQLPACRIMCLWQRSSHVQDGGLSEAITEACFMDLPLLAVSDFNELPRQSLSVSAGQGHVCAAQEGGLLLPTRWRSERCIDYWVAFPPEVKAASTVDLESTWALRCPQVYSHHCMMGLHARIQLVERPGCFLQSCIGYCKPAALDSEQWEEMVADAYGPVAAQLDATTSRTWPRSFRGLHWDDEILWIA